MVRFKAEQIKIPPVNLVLIAVLYQLLMVIGDSIFLEYSNLDITSLLYWEWMPKILDTEQMETSSWMTAINSEWSF